MNHWTRFLGIRGRRPGAFLAMLVLAGATFGVSVQTAAGKDATDGESGFERMFEIGAAAGRYPNIDNKGSDGQFFMVAWLKPREYDIRINGGRQHRFGETTWGLGASYGRFLSDRTKLTVGGSVSTGELAPEWSGSLSFRRRFGKVPVSLNYLHDHWESGARHDRVGLEAQRWFKHVILEGAARYNWNDPGAQTGWGGNVGVTYYQWKDLYVGAGWNFGKVRYLPVGPSPVLVDYDAEGYYLTFSKWFRKKSGINLRLDHAKEPEHNGIRVSWFTEW